MKYSLKSLILLLGLSAISCSEQSIPVEKTITLADKAQAVTIIRDKWGIAHVYGKTDADAVFGAVYAQAEDDFNRIEVNYLNAMGRLAEAEGEKALYRDLRMKLFIDPNTLKAEYEKSPQWLKKLMIAYADGLNYFLKTHPDVTPKVLTHFEPWMALSFTEGSIGGDIERVNLKNLKQFYGEDEAQTLALTKEYLHPEPTGSNGFAIAPSNSKTGNALLLINPHTSFYFRSELQMVSEEGLNAYGAVTWGQFFIYQGFNSKNGWMHTSSGADAIDWYEEDVVKTEQGFAYKYDDELRNFTSKTITLPYKTKDGMKSKDITVYYSHHGPVVAGTDNKWLTIKLMNEPLKALQQSYLRTKTANYQEFKETMEFHTNSSNNTVYADNSGNIAYFHGNFIPRRDQQFNWNKPVDGSTSQTEWQGLLSIDETVSVLNPKNGWLQNTNNWPYSVIGKDSPKQSDYPSYMSTFSENYRGIHAIEVLKDKKDFTIDSLLAAAYDPHLTAFDVLLPILFAQFDALPSDEQQLFMPQITALKAWDKRSSVSSTETSLAIFWGRDLRELAIADKVGLAQVRERKLTFDQYMIQVAKKYAVTSLKHAVDKLTQDFGDWQTPWGDINRFQRLTGDIVQPFDDSQPSTPVGFASSRWGSLAAFGQRTFNGTKKFYGTRGNSFVALVEFGEKVKAKAISAGGESGDPKSPHFDDQIQGYAQGQLRPVYFYRDEVEQVAINTYHPGE